MNTEMELPADVIAEIRANRKIAAIKLLRGQHGIGLKEAKEIVDVYMEEHPGTSNPQATESEGGVGRIVVLILGVGLLYSLYKYFT